MKPAISVGGVLARPPTLRAVPQVGNRSTVGGCQSLRTGLYPFDAYSIHLPCPLKKPTRLKPARAGRRLSSVPVAVTKARLPEIGPSIPTTLARHTTARSVTRLSRNASKRPRYWPRATDAVNPHSPPPGAPNSPCQIGLPEACSGPLSAQSPTRTGCQALRPSV